MCRIFALMMMQYWRKFQHCLVCDQSRQSRKLKAAFLTLLRFTQVLHMWLLFFRKGFQPNQAIINRTTSNYVSQILLHNLYRRLKAIFLQNYYFYLQNPLVNQPSKILFYNVKYTSLKKQRLIFNFCLPKGILKRLVQI